MTKPPPDVRRGAVLFFYLVALAVTAAETSSARSAFGHRSSLIDGQSATIKFSAVHGRNSLFGVRIFHLNETEASRASGHLVADDISRKNRTHLGKGGLKPVGSHAIGQITNIQLFCHIEIIFLPLIHRTTLLNMP